MSQRRSLLAALSALLLAGGLTSPALAGPTSTAAASNEPTTAPAPPDPAGSPDPDGTATDGPATDGTASHSSAALTEAAAPASTLDPSADDQPGARTLAGSVDLGQDAAAGSVVNVVGLRWDGAATPDSPGEPAAVPSMRWRDADGWGEWQSPGGTLPQDDTQHPGNAPGGVIGWGTEGAVVVGASEVQVELSGQVEDAFIEVWTTEVTGADLARVSAIPPVGANGNNVVVATRADWGANEAIRGAGPFTRSTPKLGLTVHHTAGNAYYAPEAVPAIMRSIYYYHAVTLGWGDMGYNLMVDRHGRVWEGRAGGLERNVQGAHAFGMNAHWFGISVLGNHEVALVPNAELVALAAASAWTLNHHGVSVNDRITYTNETLGWTRVMSALHTHRDVDSTSCPGRHLLALIPTLRTMVGTEQARDRAAVQRIGGADRYAVTARLAQEAGLTGRATRTAYLTRGDTDAPVDALGVGPVAADREAAVLLTRGNEVPAASLRAMTRLGTREVVLVGGRAAVSDTVAGQLRAQGLTVRRVEGTDRFDTAVRLSQEHGRADTVYLANGYQPADALSGGAAAAHVGAPMLLTRAGGLPDATAQQLARLAPSRVVVLGGSTVVKDRVLRELRALLPGAQIDRVAGSNRYATSALVARDAFGSANNAVVANGTAFVDAMGGTQLAARRDAPVLLVRYGCRPDSVHAAYRQLGIGLSRLAGGSEVLGWGAGSRRC